MEHVLRDGWWAARTPDLKRIEVPILVCGSFSDQQLHSRGSFRAFERVGSLHRWLYTHRGGKWAEYYSEKVLALQRPSSTASSRTSRTACRKYPRAPGGP